MFGSSIFEAAIGLVFIYLLLSVICSTANEWIATFINKRGTNLFDGVKNLLNDPTFTGLAQQLYTHGLVDCISKDAIDKNTPNRLPSYMAANTFALALLDILGSLGVAAAWRQMLAQRQQEVRTATAQAQAAATPANQEQLAQAQAALQQAQAAPAAAVAAAHAQATAAAACVKGPRDLKNLQAASEALQRALAAGRPLAAEHPDPLANVEHAVEGLPAGHTRETLLVLIAKTRRETSLLAAQADRAQRELEAFQDTLERWFDDAMERVGGWYKRWTQVVQFALAAVVVVLTNADTIAIADRLAHDSDLRGALVTAALETAKSDQAKPADRAGSNAGPSAAAQQKLLEQAEKLSLPLGWTCAKDGLGNCVHPRPATDAATGKSSEARTPAASASQPKPAASAVNVQRDPASAADSAGQGAKRQTWLSDLVSAAVPWLLKLIGLLISVMAVSLGAPFWFDTLSKFVNLRGAGTPPGDIKKSAGRPRAA